MSGGFRIDPAHGPDPQKRLQGDVLYEEPMSFRPSGIPHYDADPAVCAFFSTGPGTRCGRRR